MASKEATWMNTSARRGAQGSRKCHNLVPRERRDVERQLFLSDLETLLELPGLERHGAAVGRPLVPLAGRPRPALRSRERPARGPGRGRGRPPT